jgi:hypothetical protein
MSSLDPLTREANRLYARYQEELVERFSVCPWAKVARLEGRTRAHVVTDTRLEPHLLGPVIEDWSNDAGVDVAVVIAPRFGAGAEAFGEWSAAIGQLADPVFVAAGFHPDASGPGVVHFLRQTPDPTTQLVRRSRLEEIRSQDPPHYANIFELDLRELEANAPVRTVAASVFAHNTRTLAREGRDRLQRIIDDIRRDRERTYAKLLAAAQVP